jgi:hypothetical protein
MTARELEAEMLAHCAAVARGQQLAATYQREANFFCLAAMVIQSRWPSASAKLTQAGNAYFALQPSEKLSPLHIVQKGWVISLPRLRDMLSHQLQNL